MGEVWFWCLGDFLGGSGFCVEGRVGKGKGGEGGKGYFILFD